MIQQIRNDLWYKKKRRALRVLLFLLLHDGCRK
nr:MAG TPA: agnoprotein [Caudoviricetes sp.]